MERVLLVGDMARDDILADYLKEDAVLNVASGHDHPGLRPKAEGTGGMFEEMDITNGLLVADFSLSCKATLAIVSGDKPLSAGVVDFLQAANPGLLIASPDSRSFVPESDKLDSRERNKAIGMPELNPFYYYAHDVAEIDDMIADFKRRELSVVVKPQGPNGGRGVEVMGKPGHFQTYEEGGAYAKFLIEKLHQPGVLLEEELIGPEFNLQIYTDGYGIIIGPVTVDFPYRFDGDTGPNTGGTGSFSFPLNQLPPFLTPKDYLYIIQYVSGFLANLRESGLDFKGVFYPNFKLTKDGIKVIETNLRRGCPEWVNIETVTDPNISRVTVNRRIAEQRLQSNDVQFRNIASTVIYFMSRDYAMPNVEFKPVNFELDPQVLAHYGVKAYFSASKQVGPNRYQTVKTSRAVALVADGNTPEEGRAKILEAKREGGITGDLDNRTDPGSQEYIDEFMKDPRAA